MSDKLYKTKDTEEHVTVLEHLKNGYLKVLRNHSGAEQVIHESNLIERAEHDFKLLNLGDVYPFNSKSEMVSIYLIIKFQLHSDFNGFKYLDDKSFITKIRSEHKKFSVHRTEYDKSFFTWNTETFKDNADFIWQIGIDFGRVFHKKTVYERITNGYFLDKHKANTAYFNTENNTLGEIFISENKKSFACRAYLLGDLITSYDVDKINEKQKVDDMS
jgi:hypothetical protein